MLTIKEALQLKPQFILAINYDTGSLGEMMGEPRDLDLYLADMTIQYHSIVDNACLSFTIECLIKDDNGVITIDEMNTSSDTQSVYADNIEGLPQGQNYVWQDITSITLHDKLKDLIEEQPIYDTPAHYTIESY